MKKNNYLLKLKKRYINKLLINILSLKKNNFIKPLSSKKNILSNKLILLKKLKKQETIKIRDGNGIPGAYPGSRPIPDPREISRLCPRREIPGPVCPGTGLDPGNGI